MGYLNQRILNQLPQAGRDKGEYARISRLDGRASWEFLLLPAEITFERNATYSKSGAVGAFQNYQFASIDTWSLGISNLPLNTIYERKDLEGYINQLANLAVPDTQALAPPILVWRWNNRVLSPCVLVNFSKVEKLWFPDGSLAQANISFSLQQVPVNQIAQV